MKLDTHTRTHETTMVGIETTEFSMKNNAKAFSMLLDKLYTNKIRAVVRELWTNAYDSHIDAGRPAVPFDVHLPTRFDPMFRVRDYGVSLSHQQMIDLYTCLFSSSKDDSNVSVGAFGLGSKSPFAYTDQFTVTCWLDGRERKYLAAMGADGVPLLTLLTDQESDGHQGLEVAIAVKDADHQGFLFEAKHLGIGFDPVPNVDGLELKTAEPVYVADDATFAIYNQADIPVNSKVAVRQGCVIYPIDDHQLSRDVDNILTYGYRMVLNVPIGSVGITPSRESLSLDDETKAYLTQAVKGAKENLVRQVRQEVDALKSLKDAMLYWYGEQRYNNAPKSGVRAILSGIQATYNGKTLQPYLSLERPISCRVGNSREDATLRQVEWYGRDSIRFVVRKTDKKVVRALKRYSDFARSNGRSRTFLLIDPGAEDLKILKRDLYLDDNQIVNIEDIDDPGPAQRDSNGTKLILGVRQVNMNGISHSLTEIPKDFYYWKVDRAGQRALEGVVREYRGMIALGMPEKPLLTFTEGAVKRYSPDEKNEKQAARTAYLKANESAWVEWFVADDVNRQIQESRVGNLMAKLPVPAVKPPANARYGMLESGKQSITAKVDAHMADMTAKYPLLFGELDDTSVKWYIAARDAEALKP